MSPFWLIALVNLVPVAIVIASCPLRGLSRVLAPDTQLVAVLYAIFAIRPLFSQRFQASESNLYRGFYGLLPTYEGQMTASLVGMLLLWSIAIGAFFRSQWRNGADPRYYRSPALNPLLVNANMASLPHVRALICAVAAIVLYFATLVTLLGVARVLAMSRGRSAASAPQGLPEIVGILPLAGSIAAATIILMARGRPIGFSTWLSISACTALSLVAVSQLGNRRFMIPSLLIVGTALLMRKPARIRLWHAAVGLLTLLIFAVVPYVRSEGNRNGLSFPQAIARYVGETGFSGTIRNIFTTYDTEMYDYIAVVAPRLASGRADYGYGAGTILEFLTRPLPASLLENAERSNKIREYVFNYDCGISCGLPFPVPSLGGVLYFDGWYIGVVLGGILAGIATRALAYRWSHAATSTVAQNVFTAVFSSYVGIAARTETVYALWQAIYTAMIAAVVLLVLGQLVHHSGQDGSRGAYAQFPKVGAGARGPRMD
jgi:hypothetical protein